MAAKVAALSARVQSRALSTMATRRGRAMLTLDQAACLLPHPSKAKTGGEDAYFCGDSSDGQHGLYGVFDGVGGWASKGIDAGAFSRELASGTAFHLKAEPSQQLDTALAAGLADVKSLGSCTACLLRIDRGAGTLAALNLGDSGFRLFRPAAGSHQDPAAAPVAPLNVEVVSRCQQHYFNCPFQLGGGSRDRPHDGDEYRLNVSAGDVLVVATDGVSAVLPWCRAARVRMRSCRNAPFHSRLLSLALPRHPPHPSQVWDNLFDEEIAEILSERNAEGSAARAARPSTRGASRPGDSSPSALELAEMLAVRARKASLQTQRRTPFSVSAAKEGYDMPGGKLDDITVICVRVLPEQVSPDEIVAESLSASDGGVRSRL